MAAPTLQPTAEQQDILDATITGDPIAITAGAGTGKTSTLRMIADQSPSKSVLYVAYNKAIQQEADRSFPGNVTCKTAHALAYRSFGTPMRDRLNGPRRTGAQNAAALGVTRAFGVDADHVFQPASLATMAMHTVARFCRSADQTVTGRHFVPPEGLGPATGQALATQIIPLALRAWADLTCGPAGRLKPTHDVYLKQWQLSHPALDFDVVLYDEAQDADPCIADVVEQQTHAQLIAVGDSAQAIYGWRGAGDFLARLDARHRLRLTQSWRFGQAVADEANVWLDVIHADLRVAGNPARQSCLAPLAQPDAVLCRTNAGTIDALLAAHDDRTKAQLVGDGKEMLALARAADRMQQGQPAAHPELVAFQDWAAVKEYAEKDPSGSDLAVAVRMIDRYGADTVVSTIEASVPAAQAQLVVSTAHKAKGLEWSKVRIGNDFREPTDPKTGEPLTIQREEAMLAYVAVTRTMYTLDTGGLAWVHRHQEALSHGADPIGLAIGASPELDSRQTASVAVTAESTGAHGFAAVADRIDGRLDAAVPAHREPPKEENLAVLVAVQAEYADAFMREQTSEFITQTALTVAVPAPIEASTTHRKPDPVGAVGRIPHNGAAVDREAPPADSETPVPPTPDDLLGRYGLALGQRICVDGERGTYQLRGIAADGSVTVLGGPCGQWRSFRPEWCYPAERPGRGGKMVRGSLPTERRGQRAAWQHAHGIQATPATQWSPSETERAVGL